MRIFSFLIISYNRPQETVEAVQNVLTLRIPDGWEIDICVLNNGSTMPYDIFDDYWAELDDDAKSKLQYIQHNQNLGVAGGRNLLFGYAKGEYLLSMDDDSEIAEPDAIEILLDKFEQYNKDNVGLVGFSVKNYFTGEIDNPVKNKEREKQGEFLNNIFWGGAHVVKRDLIAQVGPYQDDFFYGMEEYDLAYKLMDAGYRILFTNKVTLLHKVSPEGREGNIVKWGRLFVNKSLISYKYLPYHYFITHFIMWSAYFLVRSKGGFRTYFQLLGQLKGKLSATQRRPINRSTLAYIRSVKGRLTY
jgi:GT2 family glycosyltransferase